VGYADAYPQDGGTPRRNEIYPRTEEDLSVELATVTRQHPLPGNRKAGDRDMATSDIRDLRESKGLSQTAAAEICGLSFSRYERIELGSPRTTDAEIAAVKKALRATKKTGKVLIGRPFSDPKKQAAVEKARAEGRSVAAVLAELEGKEAAATPAKRTAKKATATKRAANKRTTTNATKRASAKEKAKA
jgi:transcriptional regulator with XRE-family HTH domain